MFVEINAPTFSEIFLTSVSLLIVFGHNLWLVAKKEANRVRLEINTSDVFPESDSAVKAERVKDFRVVSPDESAPIEDYRTEETSLVAEVESGASFYAALELYAHPITLESAKFASYVRHENAEESVAPFFVAGQTSAPQRESYAKFAKVHCAVNRTDDVFNTPIKHRFEIVPQTALADLRGGKFIVQTLFEGAPLANLRVSIGGENLNGGKYVAHARTNADGLAELPIENGGHWFVRTHYIRPHADAENFDWESFWASLTFRI